MRSSASAPTPAYAAWRSKNTKLDPYCVYAEIELADRTMMSPPAVRKTVEPTSSATARREAASACASDSARSVGATSRRCRDLAGMSASVRATRHLLG